MNFEMMILRKIYISVIIRASLYSSLKNYKYEVFCFLHFMSLQIKICSEVTFYVHPLNFLAIWFFELHFCECCFSCSFWLRRYFVFVLSPHRYIFFVHNADTDVCFQWLCLYMEHFLSIWINIPRQAYYDYSLLNCFTFTTYCCSVVMNILFLVKLYNE